MGGVLALLLTTGCGVVEAGDGSDEVYDSEVTPVDLELPAPTYAVATGDGLVVRAGDATRTFAGAETVEWLPGGRALLYFPRGVRVWDPGTGALGPSTKVASWNSMFVNGDIKRSVTQVDVTDEAFKHPTRLTAYDLEMRPLWTTELPGPDDPDQNAETTGSLTRGYDQGHTIDGITYLNWSDYDDDGDESEPHYGLLRVDAEGNVMDTVQVNERIVSTWLSADGSSLLAVRRTSGDPCGGCDVDLELVELDPATGEVAAEYGMPEEYDESWDVADVDKVGDRVAVRFLRTNPEATKTTMQGTWIRDDDGWELMPGSREEITWWQGPEDRIIARRVGRPVTTDIQLRFSWVHGDTESPIPGRLESEVRRTFYHGSIPGQALPPA